MLSCCLHSTVKISRLFQSAVMKKRFVRPMSCYIVHQSLDADRARKHGMEEFISADPLLRLTTNSGVLPPYEDWFSSYTFGWLVPPESSGTRECGGSPEWHGFNSFDMRPTGLLELDGVQDLRGRLLSYSSMRGEATSTVGEEEAEINGWFSPGQVFVLDEYCARYGVRVRLDMLSKCCTSSRSMPIWVLMKDIVTPVPPEEVRGMIKKCLETAALITQYINISGFGGIIISHVAFNAILDFL
ncbi:unnamed protein product, partial [Timema podura]|nr:unnamed protein product [Timema podura]